MNETSEITNGSASLNTEVLREPKVVSIALSLCSCYSNEKINFVTDKAGRVAGILGITMQDLECAAVAAMFLGKPEVVARYVHRDVAESKLSQLKAEIPFIAKGHHSFQLVDE